MTKKSIDSVKTTGVGFAPILKHYFEKCGIEKIIDQNVALDPRRKVLTHGQACIAMITSIMFQTMQLYKICQFADKTTILDVILPGIASCEYFDDRLADTLDALFNHGIGDLELLLTRQMIADFSIACDINHYDTTSVSTFGDCDNGKTGQSIKITFGHSKKHRNDLKQLIWSMAVSSDSCFPLFQKAYSGNTADVTTYVEQWHNLIDLLDRRDFLFVGDCKLATHENMVHIHDNEGYFISPAPMYESYKDIFHKAVSDHEKEVLLPYKGRFNRGFEVPLSIDHEDKTYHFRMVVIFDHGLFKQKRTTLDNRVRKTEEAFGELSKKLNTYKLKTQEAIEKACLAIVKKYHSAEFFSFNIENEPVTTYKYAQKGRPAKGAKKIAVTEDHFTIMHYFNKDAFDQAVSQCGYYPLITNKTEESLPIYAAMMAYKNQYKSEHTNRRAKSSYNIEPIYLHTPERIEAFLFLFKIALQVIVLIERNARKNIKTRDKGLDNFMPNRKDVRNPKTENLLTEFQYVVSGKVPMPDGSKYGFVSDLTEIQKDILQVLEVPFECFSYDYIFNTG